MSEPIAIKDALHEERMWLRCAILFQRGVKPLAEARGI
jgi:hypothetical protein